MAEPLHARQLELARPFLEALAGHRPALAALFAGEPPRLADFFRGFHAARLPAIQDRADYTEALANFLHATQGEVAAERARVRLAASPVVYTANHLCLESMPLTVQSMVLAALGEGEDGLLPVEASGLIPADNSSFPAGLLLDGPEPGRLLRLPVLALSKKQRRRLALGLEGFRKTDLLAARAQVDLLFREGNLFAGEREALHRMLEEFLGAEDVLGCALLRDQAARVNPRLWKAWFSDAAQTPLLSYAPCEPLRLPLLLGDLRRSDTLMGRVLLDGELRAEVLRRLEGVPCCWSHGGREGGTAFFWKVTEGGRSAPLWIEGEALVDDEGARFPLDAEALGEALAVGQLLPSIFTTLALGLARGLVQVGGFSQLDYLAHMQRGLSEALATVGQCAWSEALATALPPMLTAGLAGLAVSRGDDDLRSAGGLALLARGGITGEHLARLRTLTLTDTMLLELPGLTRLVIGDEAYRDLPAPDSTTWNTLLKERLPLL